MGLQILHEDVAIYSLEDLSFGLNGMNLKIGPIKKIKLCEKPLEH